MKEGEEAASQYAELARALAEVDASWVVDEVEEAAARGKAVPFRDLSEDESLRYELRLSGETRRGMIVGRAKAGDLIGVPYGSAERLSLLVDATDRVIGTLERSQVKVAEFASRFHLDAIILEPPDNAGALADAAHRRDVTAKVPASAEERLTELHRVLYEEVLD